MKWTKSGGSVTGYQVAYRVKGGKWKYVTVKSNSKTLTKLKSGKTYQVKVRAYKTISGPGFMGVPIIITLNQESCAGMQRLMRCDIRPVRLGYCHYKD